MNYFAGIDGGQSSTKAVIGDDAGRIVGRGTSSAADEVGESVDSTRMQSALRGALDAARSAAGLHERTEFAVVVAGVSGYSGRVHGRMPKLPARRFVLMHDATIAHAGALGGKAGVVVIAGTGSVVYASDGFRAHTAGGWGYLFGDEGSAFWIVRETLARLMHAEDLQNGPDCSQEARETCDYFGIQSLRDLARAFYAAEISRERLASFAPRAMHLPVAAGLLEHGATRLAVLVRDAIAAGAVAKVACVGGMFADAQFYQRVRARISEFGPSVEIVEPAHEPAVGALLLAYREAGVTKPALTK
jgi:glucosamine kinase